MSITNDELKWVGIDFDHTICRNSGYPDFIPTEPIENVKSSLQEIKNLGFKIHIYTARPWSDYVTIEKWLLDNEIPFNQIHCGKLLTRVLIDDRAIRFRNWKDALTEFKDMI